MPSERTKRLFEARIRDAWQCQQFELTEAVAIKALVPAFEQAIGVKMDQRQAKLVINEFMSRFREHGDWNMLSGDIEITDDKKYDVEGEGEHIPSNRRHVSSRSEVPADYWAVDYTWKGSFMFPTKAIVYHEFNLNIPRVADGMSSLIKKLFGGEEFMNYRRSLARALLGSDKLFWRFVSEELTTKARSMSMTDFFDDEFMDHMNSNIGGYIINKEKPSYTSTLNRFVLGRVMKLVSGSAGPGSDIAVKTESHWSIRLTNEGEWEHDSDAEAKDSY